MPGPLESLPPMIDDNSRLLILGTMPGDASLKEGKYYVDNRNHFWRVLFPIFETEPLTDYKSKVTFLLANKIALWDVLKSCERVDSKDSTIRADVANNFNAFFTKHSNIQCIIFNGGPPAKKFKRFVHLDKEHESRILKVNMPSTSGLNRMPIEQKIAKWQAIKKLSASDGE